MKGGAVTLAIWKRIAACGAMILLAALTGAPAGLSARQAPDGCMDATGPGDHVYRCAGYRVDVRIPARCPAAGCGLILQLHGDTGSGLLEDAHTRLREHGAAAGYVVASPSGSTGIPAWSVADDKKIFDLTEMLASRLRVDRARMHVTGFSRGGHLTWRLVCAHADVFASAAPAGAGLGEGRGETTCFTPGRSPSRHVPLLLLIGRTDAAVGYLPMIAIRDAAVSQYAARGPLTVASDAGYMHQRWTASDGAVIETFEHGYETLSSGPWGWARGHCFPGSTTDPFAREYAVGCRPPVSFNWGTEVVKFFSAHPLTRARASGPN